MDTVCGVFDCPKQASLECTCKDNYIFCKGHMKKHSALIGCYSKSLNQAITMSIIKKKQNALNNLCIESIQLANLLIIEISNLLEENLAYINKKKNQIRNLISSKQNEKVDNIISWAENLQLLKRKRADFIRGIKNLLRIDQNSANEVTYIEKLKIKIQKLESFFEEANNINKTQEKKLNKYKVKNITKSNEIKELKKKYNESNEKLDTAKKEIYDLKAINLENQKVIKNYEAEKVLYHKKYFDACQKINILEKELAQIENVSNEKNNTLKISSTQKLLRVDKLESELKETETFFEQANSKNKQLENEITKYNKDIQDKKDKKIKQDKQNKIKQYESLLHNRQKSFDVVNIRNEALERNIFKKSIDEANEIITTSNENILSPIKKSLIQSRGSTQNIKPKFVSQSVGNY